MTNPTCRKDMHRLDDGIGNSSTLKERFQTQMSRFFSLVSRFKCPCPKPCTLKEFVLVNTQSNAAKEDLRNLAFKGRSDSSNDLCQNKKTVNNREILNQAKIRILLLRKESKRSQSIFYNAVVAMADGYNAIGFFFGITFLSVYDVVEASHRGTKRSRHSLRCDKESASESQLSEKLLINKLLLIIANFKQVASIATQNQVSARAHKGLNQRSQEYLPSLWFMGWLCCMSALFYQVEHAYIFQGRPIGHNM